MKRLIVCLLLVGIAHCGDAAETAVTLKGHTGGVESVAFRPNGKEIVSGSYGKTIKVWYVSRLVPNKSGPKNINQLLQQKFSVNIRSRAFAFAVKDIVADVRETYPSLPFDFDIKIIGSALKLEGITRNQAVRNFIQKDTSLAEILTGIVSKANPDPSVKDPSKPAQKLIWVIADDPVKAGSQIILITTRKDAEEKKYSLPKPFQKKQGVFFFRTTTLP